VSLSWEAIQTAIVTSWIQPQAAGYTVLLANQDGNKPARPFITYRFGDILPVGTDQRTYPYDEDTDTMTETVSGQREVALTVQVFSAGTVGSNRAAAVLERIRTALGLSVPRAALRNAGITPFQTGPVQDLTALNDADFEGRAALTVRCTVTETVAQEIGYFNQVEVTSYMGYPTGDPDTIDI
jgi:hypothetical protein